MVEIDDRVFNNILDELKEIKKLRKDMKKLEKKVDMLSYTKKDIEIFNLVKEMEKEDVWGSEEDLEKSGIKI